jgi:hypothetical protein
VNSGDQTSFNRMRRLNAQKHLVKPAAGMNVRETIAADLRASQQPSTLESQMELARLHREGHRDAAAAADTFIPPTSADPDAQRAAPTSAAPLNTREIAHRAYVEDRPLASVTLEGGQVVDRHSPDPAHAPFSAEHYAPPTSVSPGSDNEVPEPHDSHGEPPALSVDPDADRAAYAERRNLALGFKDRHVHTEAEDKRREEAAKETETAREAALEAAEDEEETREEAADANVAVGALDDSLDPEDVPERHRKPARRAPPTAADRQERERVAAEKQAERVKRDAERKAAKPRRAAKKAE